MISKMFLIWEVIQLATTVMTEEDETLSESDSENFDYGKLFHTTRSGRFCGGPNLHKYR